MNRSRSLQKNEAQNRDLSEKRPFLGWSPSKLVQIVRRAFCTRLHGVSRGIAANEDPIPAGSPRKRAASNVLGSELAAGSENADAPFVIPFGTSRWTDPDTLVTYDQVFSREQGESMVNVFNSLWSRWLDLFRGLPIYMGHPDVDPDRWRDERRLGKIKNLRVTDEGLEVTPSWNKIGRENQEEGYLVYPSPVWLFPIPAPGDTAIYPDVLQSIGLTNSPNIRDVPPVSANVAPASGGKESKTSEAEETKEPSEKTEPKPKAMNEEELNALKKQLGLSADATIEDVNAKIKEIQDKAAANAEEEPPEEEPEKKTPEEKSKEKSDDDDEKSTAENALRKNRTDEADRLIALGLSSGAITGADQAGIRSEFEKDHQAASNSLVKKIQDHKTGGLNDESVEVGNDRHVSMNAAQARETMISEVHALMDDKNLDYTAAYNSVSSQPKWVRYFDGVEKKKGDPGK